MKTSPRLAPGAGLLLALLALPLFAACGTSSNATDVRVPHAIPYADVDRRAFIQIGETMYTTDGALLSVEAAERDTLIWFKSQDSGRFRNAFLRRGNSIYVLGSRGDYRLASSAQTVTYSLFMQRWRRALALLSAEGVVHN